MIPKNLNAAVLLRLNSKLKILKIKIPELKKNQVLVKISYSAICRSQLMEIFSGRKNEKWLPHMLGHEASGEIAKLGKNVKNLKIGQKVILTWIKSNLKDSANPNYIFKNKKINAGKITTFSNYSIVSQNRIMKKPRSVQMKNSVLLGCCFLTGPGMVYNETSPKKNMKIVVIGLGAVGLGCLLALKEKGINSIVVIEKDKKKTEIAKKLGIKLIVNSIDKKSKLEIIKFFRGKVDLCYDSAGSIKTLEASLDLLKNDGRLHFASHPDEKLKMKIKPYDFILGKRISGSWAGGCSPGRDVNKFSKIINNNKKLINSLLLKEYNLEDINVAIKDFIDGKVFRPIIKMRH